MSIKTREQIRIERARLDEQERELKAAELNALRETIARLANEEGMQVDAYINAHLLGGSKPTRKAPARGVVPAKYVSPNDESITWSGKGKAPGWFSAALKQGYSKEDMEIDRRPVPDTTGLSNGARA